MIEEKSIYSIAAKNCSLKRKVRATQSGILPNRQAQNKKSLTTVCFVTESATENNRRIFCGKGEKSG